MVKKRLKKLMAMFLAAGMLLSAFGGCGNAPDNESASEETTEKESDAKEGETAQEVEEDPFAEEVTLVYVLPNWYGIEPNIEAIMEEVNKYTKEKINTKIELELIPGLEFTEKMNMKYTAGEKWDVTHGGWLNPFASGVSMGAFAEIPMETLQIYAPEYTASISDEIWSAVKINDKIYGCPIEQQWSRQSAAIINKELATKYNFDYTKVTKLEDLTEFLAIVKENEPDAVPINLQPESLTLLVNYMGWDVISTYNVPGVVYDKADTATVINQFETEEFREYCELAHSWYEAGYVPADAATGGESSTEKVKGIVGFDVYTPGRVSTYKDLYECECDFVKIGELSGLKSSLVQEHLQVISSGCENIERAVAFINLLNSDKYLLSLFCNGIEGQDYEFVDKEKDLIEITGEHYMYSFLIGNTTNEYYSNPVNVGANEEIKELNASSEPSVIMGFTFNADNVTTEIAQCTAVSAEYLPALVTGSVDPDTTIDAFLAALEEAGAPAIIAEMQAQIDAWAASK